MTSIRGAVLALAMTLPVSAVAAPKDKGPARMLLSAMWSAEPLMADALRTRDEFAMTGQALKLSGAVGQTDRETALTSPCFKAADSMANVARGLAQTMDGQATDYRVRVVQVDYKTWREAIDRCESVVGEKRKRALELE